MEFEIFLHHTFDFRTTETVFEMLSFDEFTYRAKNIFSRDEQIIFIRNAYYLLDISINYKLFNYRRMPYSARLMLEYMDDPKFLNAFFKRHVDFDMEIPLMYKLTWQLSECDIETIVIVMAKYGSIILKQEVWINKTYFPDVEKIKKMKLIYGSDKLWDTYSNHIFDMPAIEIYNFMKELSNNLY